MSNLCMHTAKNAKGAKVTKNSPMTGPSAARSPDCPQAYNSVMHALSTDELLNYCAEETQHWREWFEQNPAALDLPCDIAGTKNVREVVLHIAAIELRYAE